MLIGVIALRGIMRQSEESVKGETRSAVAANARVLKVPPESRARSRSSAPILLLREIQEYSRDKETRIF